MVLGLPLSATIEIGLSSADLLLSAPDSTVRTAMAAAEGKLHVAMFPWLAFGHIIPYLELAKLIASKGHRVSFISAPQNIRRLPKLPTHLSPLVEFIGLPLPRVENLPGSAEATGDLPFNKVKYLKIAVDGLQEPMRKFLETSSPHWILFDFVPYWLGPLATELRISSGFFSIFTAAILGLMGPPQGLINAPDDIQKIDRHVSWVKFETTVGMKPYELQRTSVNFVDDSGNVADQFRFGKAVINCDAVFVRSCPEFEPEWLELLSGIYPKPVVPVGLLPVTANDSGADEGSENSWTEIKGWLDLQATRSVVYIAFGSETKLTQDELTELAFGLEISRLPFFWVMIKRRGPSDTESVELPNGFEERTRGQGWVYTNWAPQLKILSHCSVGGIVSHAGWSTVVEGLQFGRALIVLPFLGDQGIIATELEEKKVAYAIPRDERDGSFTRDSVADSLSLVMVREEGKMYRDKAMEMMQLFGDRDKQDHYLENLLSYLHNHKCIS